VWVRAKSLQGSHIATPGHRHERRQRHERSSEPAEDGLGGRATVGRMEPEEQEPRLLIGWFVVEAGRRQAWPFLGLASPDSDREVRIYIDATLSVLPGWPSLDQDDDAALRALDGLVGLAVGDVQINPGTATRFVFDDLALEIEAAGNALTTHSPWWIGSR